MKLAIRSVKRFMGIANTKTKAEAAEIDNAERVVVDSSALHCPICLSIFSSTPVVLPCGHSFCKTCITRLIQTSYHFRVSDYRSTFECALCREKCYCDVPMTKNYVVDALLQSVDEIAALENVPEADMNLRISNKHLKQKLREVDELNHRLEQLLEEQRHRNRVLTIVVGVATGILAAVVMGIFRFS